MHKSLGFPPSPPGRAWSLWKLSAVNVTVITVITVCSRPTRRRRSFRLDLYYGKFRGGLHRGSRECAEGRDGRRRRPPHSLRCCRPCSASCETLFGLGGKDSRRWRSALSSMKPSHPTAASTNASRRPSGSPAAPAATPRGHPPGSGCIRRPAQVLAFSAQRARGSRQLSSAVHSLSAAAADCTSSFRTTGASRRLISSRKLSTPCSSRRSTSGCCVRESCTRPGPLPDVAGLLKAAAPRPTLPC